MSVEERTLFLNLMIKHLRLSLGWTQTQLAERLRRSQTEVWRYETPGYKVSPKVLIELSDVFGCSMDVLFGNTQHSAKLQALEEFKTLKVSKTWI